MNKKNKNINNVLYLFIICMYLCLFIHVIFYCIYLCIFLYYMYVFTSFILFIKLVNILL